MPFHAAVGPLDTPFRNVDRSPMLDHFRILRGGQFNFDLRPLRHIGRQQSFDGFPIQIIAFRMRAVDHQVAAFPVLDEHADGNAVEDGLQQPLIRGQLLFGLPLLRNVQANYDQPGDRATAVADGGFHRLEAPLVAPRSHEQLTKRLNGFIAQQGGTVSFRNPGLLILSRTQNFEGRLANCIFGFDSVEFTPGLIDQQIAAVLVL